VRGLIPGIARTAKAAEHVMLHAVLGVERFGTEALPYAHSNLLLSLCRSRCGSVCEVVESALSPHALLLRKLLQL
jgi:hypothetical protein